MSQEQIPPIPVPTGESLSWSQVWVRALTRPTVENYEEIVADSNVSASKAYTWVFLSTLISFAISILVQLLFIGISSLGSRDTANTSSAFGGYVLFLFCGTPVAAAVSILGLMITTGITQAIARALGGTGTYTKLAYALAAYLAPLTLVSTVIGLVPIVNLLAYPLGLYGIVLNVIAVKAVNGFGWGKAFASSVLIFAAILVLVACVTIVILTLLGPAIGNVFSTIIQQIGTPTP